MVVILDDSMPLHVLIDPGHGGDDPGAVSHDTAPSGLDTAPSGLDTAPSGLDTAPSGLDTAPSGHGGDDPGAVSHGVREADRTLILATALWRRLDALGVVASMTRSGDETLSGAERLQIAHQRGAALMVSVHHNAVAEPSPTAHGIEVLGHDRLAVIPDRRLEQTAGVTLARELPRRLGMASRGWRPGYRRTWHFAQISIPVVLVEYGFLDSEIDRVDIADDDWLVSAGHVTAMVLYDILKAEAFQRSTTDREPTPDEPPPWWV